MSDPPTGVTRVLLGSAAMLLAAGCSPAGTTTPSTTHSPAQITVTSTLDGLSSLPLRIQWVAMPSAPAAQVTEVDFLIDGQLAWVDHASRYYGDSGNWLVTSFLMPGAHTFTVRVLTIAGQSATSTVQATVAAPPPVPLPGLAGTWARTVTAADVAKATSGLPPPAGNWQLTIAPRGWESLDPNSVGGLFDVGYQSGGIVEMRPTIEYPPYPNSNKGGWCADTDPLFDWTVAVGGGGKTLTLNPVGQDPCGDRVAVLEGTWTRVGH